MTWLKRALWVVTHPLQSAAAFVLFVWVVLYVVPSMDAALKEQK